MSRVIVACLVAAFLGGCLQVSYDAPPPAPAPEAQPEPTSPTAAPPASPRASATSTSTSTAPATRPAQAPANESEATGNETEPATPPAPPPVWGDSETALIHPGIRISTGLSACTTNFLFTSQDNQHIYLGSAAHCFGNPGSREVCSAAEADTFLPPGSPVTFLGKGGVELPVQGRLAFSSFQWMQQNMEPGPDTCPGANDFALVEIPIYEQGNVTPHFPVFGPATEILPREALPMWTEVVLYGQSSYWRDQEQLEEAWGFVTRPSSDERRWSLGVTLNRPSVWGDSGAAVLTADGGAAAVVVTIGSGNPGADGWGTNGTVLLQAALDYLHAHTEMRIQLAQP